ncbi:hypothetical protein ACH4TX_40775 [Streptomyces sp. NPDC021098]|uniref:hypothetical protein n=1 Tax=unclassified Streptomyces TaxID=2593676 RepID=UPI0037B707B1
MGWQSEEFGSFHEGTAGAVLGDGSEPGPVYVDAGSGSHMPAITDWWVYDGTLGAPRATHLRGSCSCGWRGERRYAIDWGLVAEDPYDADTSGPRDDWAQHIEHVKERSVPLPVALEGLLAEVDQQLTALAADAPLAALRAVAALERTTKRIGREAAYHAEADELSWETIGKALGITEKDARSRLVNYSLR